MVKLTHFIQWPDIETRSQIKENFTICINHSHKLNDSLSVWAQTGVIKNKPVSIKYFQHKQIQLTNCDMLFITENSKLNYFLNLAKDNHTLTVSDTPGNAQKGVLINFISKEGKLRFEINLGEAKKLGYKINSRLLKLATIVSSEGGDE